MESLLSAQRLAKEAAKAPTSTSASRLIRQAFDVARRCEEPYHAAMAANRPLKALRIRGHNRALSARTDEILDRLDEMNCVSRLWVLSFTIGALCGGPKDDFVKVVRRFISEARPCRSWRTPRIVLFVIGAVEIVDSRLADDVLNIFETPSARDRASQILAQIRAHAPTVQDCWWPNLD